MQDAKGMSDETAYTILAISAAIYVVPMFIAICRGHRNAAAISILNILAGWTLVGWIAALVWSFTVQTPTPQIQMMLPPRERDPDANPFKGEHRPPAPQHRCSECKTLLPPPGGAKFCPGCGRKLSQEVIP